VTDGRPLSIEAYRRPGGTTLMLLNGELFISFVPNDCMICTYFSGSDGSMQSEKFSLSR
jgi:hypothetical protein